MMFNNLTIMQKINQEVDKIHLKNFAMISNLLFEAHRHIENNIEGDFRIEETFHRRIHTKFGLVEIIILDPPCMKTEKDHLEEKIVNNIIKKHPTELKALCNKCLDIKIGG